MFDAIGRMHERLATATGGRTIVPLTWAWGRYLVTPHPLGGARMSSDPLTGVVDHRGRVWGHPNLYVADGSIIPTAIGANPSRTIAALAERIAAIAIAEGQ
jgi:cholesterol oxidase